jgi:hypothetical protein
MLSIFKNEAITHVQKQGLEIRQMELDWYTTNYDTMAMQAAMFAGFAFEQITEPVPDGTDFKLEVIYITLTGCTLGLQLCVCLACTFCCIFGKGLALRGPNGARSVHVALDNLHKEQKTVFIQFLLGILTYLASSLVGTWISFRPRIAFTVSIPLFVFFFAIIYYVMDIYHKLYLGDDKALTGHLAGYSTYERIHDLDEEVHKPLEGKRYLSTDVRH